MEIGGELKYNKPVFETEMLNGLHMNYQNVKWSGMALDVQGFGTD